MHQSFFTSLGIPAPPGREPFRVRIWPVLTRDKNAQKETLMCSKDHTSPSLPLNIRLKGPAEALEEEWSSEAAWRELIHRVEAELIEQTLRYYLTISEKPRLEWSWHEEPNRGGRECTILAHIHTGTNGVSVKKKEAPPLDSSGPHAELKQRNSVNGPGSQLTHGVGGGVHDPPRTQEQVG
jgi:hypothetical protein